MKTRYLIKPFEEHPDFEELVKQVPAYYQKDSNGKLKTKKGKPIKNEQWASESPGFRNPFFREMVAEIRALRTEHPRLDGKIEATGMWIDFGCPREDQLPLEGEISFRYGDWPTRPHLTKLRTQYRYCYVSVEWTNPEG